MAVEESKPSWAFGLTAPLLGGAIFLALIGWGRLQVFLKAHDPPEKMTLATLASEGPKGNIHISLDGFQFGSQLSYHVNSSTGKWGRVCLAAFPENQVSEPSAPMVLVRTYEIKDAEQAKPFLARSSATGILINGIEPCESDQKDMATKYGRSDSTSIPVLDSTVKIPSFGEVCLFIGLAIAFGITGGIGLVERVRLMRSLREPEAVLSPAAARIGGIVSLVGALVLSKFCIFDVLQAAQHRAPYIWWLPVLAALCPAGALLGIFSLITGKTLANFRDQSGKLSAGGLTLVFVLAATGSAATLLLFRELNELGYWHKPGLP